MLVSRRRVWSLVGRRKYLGGNADSVVALIYNRGLYRVLPIWLGARSRGRSRDETITPERAKGPIILIVIRYLWIWAYKSIWIRFPYRAFSSHRIKTWTAWYLRLCLTTNFKIEIIFSNINYVFFFSKIKIYSNIV